MKMDKVAGSGNDEFYTPAYAVRPLLKYLKPQSNIWCPFDTDDSLFVKILCNEGHTVTATHLSKGEDFFELGVPEGTDYIVSNPPYSMKTEVLQRLFELKVPFAMLLGVVGIFESQKRFSMFRDNQFEVMYFNKRIAYMEDYLSGICAKQPPFSSVYITSNVLPNQIVFEEVDKKDILFTFEEVGDVA